ncbi:MAG: rod shape-determining protein RodA [Deltaproteobacteria bacterium]|jgi:rod shape determining protein RodA|nr:rod shape-determining protein RodA [Deltaproteobacteria bacterium]
MSTAKKTTAFSWPLLGVTMTIVVVGLVNLYSAVYFWGEGGSQQLFWSQLVWTVIGSVIMVLVAALDYRIFYRFSYVFYILVSILLVLALILGQAVRGTHGWIQLGPVSLQPAEFAKLAYIFVAARYFANNPNPDGYRLLELWKPGLLMLISFTLIVVQGDMGSSLFIICIFISMSLFAKVKKRTIVSCAILAAIVAIGVYNFGLKDYQKERIFTFMNPEADVRGGGYHLMQSKIAVGSGQMFGKGYLKGNINKLRYLPERHTDFIFPVFAEEWGFFGSLLLLALYAALLLIGIDIGSHARDRFGAFVAIGVVSLLFWQLAINLGGVLGLMPLTGVTLPLMSYGGSSMIAIMASIGLLFSIYRRRFMF